MNLFKLDIGCDLSDRVFACLMGFYWPPQQGEPKDQIC